MEKAIRYRLYPTNEQKIYFIRTFGCCRKVWNLMLLDKIQHYKETGQMLYNRPAQYKKRYPYLKEVDSLGSLTKLAIASEKINKPAHINRLKDKTIINEVFIMFLTHDISFWIYSAINLVDVLPMANVAKVAIVNIVVLTKPYSPYKSFPNSRAIKMPDSSNKKLPIPLPKTAQKEFL